MRHPATNAAGTIETRAMFFMLSVLVGSAHGACKVDGATTPTDAGGNGRQIRATQGAAGGHAQPGDDRGGPAFELSPLVPMIGTTLEWKGGGTQ